MLRTQDLECNRERNAVMADNTQLRTVCHPAFAGQDENTAKLAIPGKLPSDHTHKHVRNHP